MSIYGLSIEESSNSTKSILNQISNRIQILYSHMLKYKYQQNKQTSSWIKTILEQSRSIQPYISKNSIFITTINKIRCYLI